MFPPGSRAPGSDTVWAGLFGANSIVNVVQRREISPQWGLSLPHVLQSTAYKATSLEGVCVCACGHVCVRACVCACVRMCACACACGVACFACLPAPAFFSLIHRSHSISFTRAQGIPKYKIGFGREKDGRVGERLVEGAFRCICLGVLVSCCSL